MPLYDLLLKGGTVIDGQRTPRYTSDIAIADGRIAHIGRVAESDAARVYDARDLIVAPGSSTCTRISIRRSSGIPTARCRVGTA